jgi:hypothetical protein
MTADSSGSTPIRRWSWLRWVSAVAVVFAAHVVLILAFGEHKPPAPVRVRHTPSLALVGESPGDWQALNDATLFALPENDGFSASMWTEIAPLDISEKIPPEEPHWLSPSNSMVMARLGAAFKGFVQTNHVAVIHFEFNLPPQVAAPVASLQPPIAPQSTLEIQGALAGRRLLNPVNLPSWQDADVDAPSIVQVLVDAAGNVVSAALLPQQIMSQQNSWEPPLVDNANADQWAVELARTLRFSPLPSPTIGGPNLPPALAIGRLIFNWQTVPVTTTNGPA